MMSDLVAWLTKILDEDEAVVERAVGDVAVTEIDNYGHLTVPASWMLADIAAKRAIVEMCREEQEFLETAGPALRDEYWSSGQTLREVVKLLASAYADHPGYREEWRP